MVRVAWGRNLVNPQIESPLQRLSTMYIGEGRVLGPLREAGSVPSWGGQLKNQDAGEVSAKSDLVLEIYHPRSLRRDADPDGHTSTQGLSDVS